MYKSPNTARGSGSFAVVALMAGVANDKVMFSHGGGVVEFSRNATHFDVTTRYEVTPIQIATTLTFAIGIWQVGGNAADGSGLCG